MNEVAAVKVWGRPRFVDGGTQTPDGSQADDTAWRTAWQTRPAGSTKNAVEVAQSLSGPFAVGIRFKDGRAWLAVDRFAIQSLCYRIVQGRLHFAERADELAALPDVPPAELEPQALFDYLYFHAIPSPRTIYHGVCRLPPGHCAVFDGGRLSVMRYWQPTFSEASHPNFSDLRDEFRHLLKQAVSRELDSGKAGCFLSGGTDSSTVAGMIGQGNSKPAATYSIGFEAEGYDEMAFARIAARHFGTDHHEYYVTPDDLVAGIPMVASAYDQPFGNSSALPAYYCARMAGQDGVTRILAGDGGDELFGGNTRYAKQRVFGIYQKLPPMLRSRVMQPLLQGTPLGGLPVLKKGRSYIEQALVPLPDRLQSYNLLERLGVDEVLEPEFLRRVDARAPGQHQRDVWSSTQTPDELNQMLAYDWRYTLGEIDLPKVCGTTRLAGLEVGFPMLDADLVDFSLRLPVAYKLKGLKLRWFFKEALRGFLPNEILVKKKQGFGLPFGVWLQRNPKLKRLADESLRSLATRRLVRGGFIDDLLVRRLAEHPAYYGEMIWILMMLEQWLLARHPDYRAS